MKHSENVSKYIRFDILNTRLTFVIELELRHFNVIHQAIINDTDQKEVKL